MAYEENVNVNLNVLAGTMGGITAIMGGMSALTSSFGAMSNEAANSFGMLDGLLVSATALLSTFAIQSAEAFGQFEQGMKVVQTVSGQSTYAINELSNQANQMAIAYRTSINDITDGLQTLGRAGLNSVSEQLEVLESGLQTAKLEGRNLNGVLEELIQNTAMLGGDLKSTNFGEQTEYLNTIMIGTSMTAPINSHDISQTLQYAGGTAAAAGANLENKDKLEDLMGTVAAFAQKGVTGSMAGTALRAFFTKPASQDESVTNALSTIGLKPEDLWENGGESMKKVSDQVGIIHNRMEALNMSTMDQVELWGKIVGPKMGQQMMKLDSSTIKDLTRDIESASSAEELATQTLHTYSQQLAEMSEQGSLAYREFGSHVASFLQPVVFVITKILGLLSDPHINTAAFIAVGSLLAHGFRKAWNIIATTFSQIKALLSETAMAMRNINGASGGLINGFTQAGTEADFLNRKLHETDATLQAIQAKSMGIKPGYIMPGSHGFETVPRGTLKAYEEDVIVDKAGVMGSKGQIYPGQYKDRFVESTKKEIIALEEQHEAKKLATEEKIAAIQQKQIHAQEVADATHAEKMTSLNATMKTWKQTGLDPIAQKEMLKDYEYNKLLKQYGSVGNIPKASLDQIRGYYINDSSMRGLNQDNWYNEQKSMIDSQKTQWLNPLKAGYAKQISGLEEEVNVSEKSLGLKKEQLKSLEKQGITKLQTRMDMKTVGQFRQWMRGLDENDPMQAYSKMRTQEMIKKHPELYREYARQGYMPAFVSKAVDDSHPNSSILGQLHNKGVPQQWIDADKARIAQQKAMWAGELSYSNKARQIAEQRMNAWGNAVSKGTKAITSLPSKIANIPKQISMSKRDAGTYLGANASQINRQAAALNLEKLNMAGMSAAQALDVVAKELGLTKTELSMLMASEEKLAEVTNLSGSSIAQLTRATDILKSKIIEATATESLETEAGREFAVVMEQDMVTVSQHRVAMAANISHLGGIKGAISGFGSSIKGAASTVVGYMGGPFMTAMMGFTLITQQISEQQQHWQERMQEASDQLSEAKDAISQSSENLKNEIYGKEYDNLSDADTEKITDSQYAAIVEAYDKHGTQAKFSEMYNNEVVKVENLSWTKEERDENTVKTSEQLEELNSKAETLTLTDEANIKALEENTASVRAAAYEYSQALQKVAKEGSDGAWGFAGISSNISDATGDLSKGNFLNTGIIPEITNWLNQTNNGFFDNDSPVLLPSQSDKNYAFGTDFASVFMADFYRFDIEEGLKRFFGNDYNQIISLIGGIDNKMTVQTQYGSTTGPSQLLSKYANYFNQLPESDTALALSLMKDNPDDASKLGKQMFRVEQQEDFKGRTAAQRYFDNQSPTGSRIKKGGPVAGPGSKNFNKLLKDSINGVAKKKLTVQDKNLKTTIDKFRTMTGNKLNEQTILMMGNLQQMSDMNKVAQEQIAPGVTQTVQTAGQIMSGTMTAADYAGSASDGAGGAAANAYAIAVFLQAKAQETSIHDQYQKYLKDPDAEKSWFGLGGKYSEQEFTDKISQKNGSLYEKYGKGAIEEAAIATSMITHPERSYDQHLSAGKNALKSAEEQAGRNNAGFQDMLNTVTRGLPGVLQKQIMSAYDQSDVGEYGGGNKSGGSGSGGSGGSGSGKGSNKDNTGSKTNRVDLVLCNKKTIPKLNVNLFKKPPQFTIKNKQFSIRDINVNTQDKPNAMVDAVKESIIKTQRQMDPKIIQSEEAVYDPVDATEGATPSGKMPVATK